MHRHTTHAHPHTHTHTHTHTRIRTHANEHSHTHTHAHTRHWKQHEQTAAFPCVTWLFICMIWLIWLIIRVTWLIRIYRSRSTTRVKWLIHMYDTNHLADHMCDMTHSYLQKQEYHMYKFTVFLTVVRMTDASTPDLGRTENLSMVWPVTCSPEADFWGSAFCFSQWERTKWMCLRFYVFFFLIQRWWV